MSNSDFEAPPIFTAAEARRQGYEPLTTEIDDKDMFVRFLHDMQGIEHCVVRKPKGPEIWRKGMIR